MSAKAVVCMAWCEAQERERLTDQLRQANQKALARLVRDLVAKAGPRPKRGRPRLSGPRSRAPLSSAECQRLWRTYRLGQFDRHRCDRCSDELLVLLDIPPSNRRFVFAGLKDLAGRRSRRLYGWLRTNIRFLTRTNV